MTEQGSSVPDEAKPDSIVPRHVQFQISALIASASQCDLEVFVHAFRANDEGQNFLTGTDLALSKYSKQKVEQLPVQQPE